ncbi:phage baseplate plug family protein [Furfurilactobacillus sp. WILCCON 0119]
MSLRKALAFQAAQAPSILRTTFGQLDYYLALTHNETGHFYTIDLYDVSMNPLVLGEKLVLNQPLFNEVIDERLPAITLVPLDEAGHETTITPENFGKTVFIYLDTLAYDPGDPDAAFIHDFVEVAP